MALQQLPELEQALQIAHTRGASDVFLIPGEPLSLRVNGVVERGNGDVLNADVVEKMVHAAFGAERVEATLSATGKAQTSVALPGVVHGQMFVARASGSYTVALRVFRGELIDVATIGVPQAVLQAASSERGLIVFTGPIGSGKTTTALSVLDHINATQARMICTIEDPIAIAGIAGKRSIVVQREIGQDLPDTASGIVSAITQDADVLFVGEMRNPAEVTAVAQAAHLQCLVLTQMHQHSARGAIQRLIEVQPAELVVGFRRQLAEVLRCVIAQKLLPRAGGKGRVAAYGVLVPDDELRSAIVEGRELPERSDCEIDAHVKQLIGDGIVSASLVA